MLNEIDISKVPLTPKGRNYDFKAVKNFAFVRFDPTIAWKTVSLIGPESDVSDIEDAINENNVPIVDVGSPENILDLHQSPMIEFRKKRSKSLEGEFKFNPVNNEVMDTSLGWYKNYEVTKRRTIADWRRLSVEKLDDTSRNSLPAIFSDTMKENVSPIDYVNTERNHLDLLRDSVSETRPLLTTERDRLSTAIVDWQHILKNEEDVPPEAQGRIQSTIGRTQILLNKRFNSTFDVLDKAESYAINDGVIADETEKEYKPDDVYGFVDLLINEIKKIDNEYQTLLDIRNNGWTEEVPKKNVIVKKKPLLGQVKKAVKSRLDVRSLKRKFAVVAKSQGNRVTGGDEDVEEPVAVCNEVPVDGFNELHVDMDSDVHMDESSEQRVSDSKSAPLSSDFNQSLMSETDSMNESHRSLRNSVRKTVRANQVIKSTTGTPVHCDTPRPPRRSNRKSVRATQTPIIESPVSPSGHKRALMSDDAFLLPMSQPKKARQSKI